MIVSVGIFTVVVTISIGALLVIVDTSHRAEATRIATDNLNLAIEDIIREVRTGNTYDCDGSDTFDVAEDCPSGSNVLSFTTGFDDKVTYKLAVQTIDGKTVGRIMKRKGEVTNDFVAVTSKDTNIEVLNFVVLGAESADIIQPYVRINIHGSVLKVKDIESRFNVQTVATQRILDWKI